MASCDGGTSWEQQYDPVSGASQASRWSYVRPLSSLSPPLSQLLRPSWLPAGFQLEVIGPAAACGRDAVEFAGRPRPLVMAEPIGDRVVAVADLELGILLRCGRRGYQITARPADRWAWSFSGHYVSGQELPAPAVAVVDADSGVLLSLTAFSGEQPALHAELRELTFEPQPRDDDFQIGPSPDVIVTEQDDVDVDETL